MAKHKIVPAFTDKEAAQEVDVMLNSVLKTKGKEVLDTLLKGGTRTELTDRLAATLDTGEGYIKTYVDTSLSVIARRRLSEFADELGLVWYKYIGGLIKTTREFCEEKNGEYFHESEIESWPATEAPWDGMIEGTTSENIFDFCGGWNCRHQLVPVATSSVPLPVKNEFETGKPPKAKKKKAPAPAVPPPAPVPTPPLPVVPKPVTVIRKKNPAKDKILVITEADKVKANELVTALEKNNRWSDEYIAATNTLNAATPEVRESVINVLSSKVPTSTFVPAGTNLTEAEYAAQSYGRNWFRPMGALARGYVKETDLLDLQYSAKSIVELDKGFKNLATPTKQDILYRGVSRRLTENVKVGDIISDQGFTSTTSSETIAKQFGTGVDFFHFKKMANVSSIDMTATGLATHREAEFVLPRLRKFKVVKIQRGPKNIITLVPIK